MELDEPVEERLERLGGGQADVPRADLGLQAAGLALDLVTELGRQALEVLVVRSGERQERRDTVLARRGSRSRTLAPQPPRSADPTTADPPEPTQVCLGPVVRAGERREQLLRDVRAGVGSATGPM
jgi:hypothetical protein